MKLRILFAALVFCLCRSVLGDSLETVPSDAYFANFQPLAAPKAKKPLLRAGSRLAICGDSITEQKMYSRIMETYITVALPELGVSVRQFGWSGEQASGFLHRMTNDVLRFKPTVATTCYGMNDHHYRPYDESIGDAYRSNMMAIIDAFKSTDTKVIVGSPGCMGLHNPSWSFVKGTPAERNLNLCTLRNIDIQLAETDHVTFADVFWPMFDSQFQARQRWGENYALAGKDNVHPGWAGHLIMAYAFLKALDVPGDIATIRVNLNSGKARASRGHEIISSKDGIVTIKSARFPFCATGDDNSDNSIRSGMALVPFNQDFNRFLLIAKGGKAENYKVTWGDFSHDYTGAELKNGVNLAADFPVNPFSEAFKNVDEAVGKKQAFETRQIKELFHGPEGKSDMEKTADDTERERAPLVAAIQTAFVPVTYTIAITPK